MHGSTIVAACIVTIVTASIGVLPATRVDASDGAAEVIASYRARIPVLMAEEEIAGLAIALVDGDRVVWQEGFGFTDTDRRTPITTDTIFSVQSMSKLFTATAVMQKVQAGRLDLDLPITTYLPSFTVHSAFETHPEQKITLRMLLSHTAGFTHEAPVGNNYESEPGDFDAHIRSISDTWLRFPVGTGYAYSNLGIDLAGFILEQVSRKPYPAVMADGLLAPLGMDHSTFDRERVHATADRAVGHSEALTSPPADVPMMAAGGLWTTAADLATFLRFQLGDGTIDGRTLLDRSLMEEMRTVPAPHASAPAGYALGVARTRWRAGHYLDLFSHGGAAYGFVSDLLWLPQLQLGITILTNSAGHDLQGELALGILRDLVNEPGSIYHDRILSMPMQSDVIEPDGHWVAPPDLSARIAAVAMPTANDQPARWARYVGQYRTGRAGEMNVSAPPSRFVIDSGVPYYEAAEDGAPIRHRLTEFQPGLFLSDDGETLDLRGPPYYWRGVDLVRVTGGPLPWQWALLGLVALAVLGWFAGAATGSLRRRGMSRASAGRRDGGAIDASRARGWRRATTVIAVLGAVLAVPSIAAIVALPGLVDTGFLGGLALLPFTLRVALHLPLALAILAGCLLAMLAAGWVRGWWTPRAAPRDTVLAVALGAFSLQLGAWHMVGWGFS